jgi:hypothetical protein
LAALDDFRLDLLLLAGLESAFVLRLLAHPLHRVQHILLLCEESVAEIRGPLNVFGQTFNYLRYGGHRLDARIPRLLCDGIGERLVLQSRIFLEPLLQLDELERISRGGKRLRD